MTVGTLWAFLKLDDKQYNKALDDADKHAKKTTESMAKRFAKMGDSLSKVGKKLSLFVTAPILAMGAAMVKSAIDAEETKQKFEVVFSDIGDRAESAMRRLVDGFGFAQAQAQKLLGDTGDLLTGFGFTQDSALDLSLAVNELAADLASFTNFSGGAEGASVALTKAMLGESEQAKALGIVIRQDSDEYKNLIDFYMKTEGASLLQAKALTALKMATDQSKNAIGDYARTQEGAANIIRDTLNDVKDLAVEMGTFLIPIVKDVVKRIKELIDRFMNMSDSSKMLILRLAGIAAAAGPVLLFVGNLIKSFKILIPLMKILASPAGLIGAAVVAFTMLVVQYAKWKRQQKENIELLNKNNEILFGTKIAINGVTTALGLENDERVEKLELLRAEKAFLLEMEIDALLFAERAAKGEASFVNAQGLRIGMTLEQIEAQKKAIPIHEQRIELLGQAVDLLDAAIAKTTEVAETTTTTGASTAKAWQDINTEVFANIAAENILIDKQAELAEAIGQPFDVIKEKKKVLEEAIKFLLDLSAEEVNEPYALTDQTIIKLIDDLEALGLTATETAAAQKEGQETVVSIFQAALERLAEEREQKELDAAADIEREENLQATIAEIMARRRQERLDAETAVEEAITELKAENLAKQEQADKDAADRKKLIIRSVWKLAADLGSSLSSLLTSFNNKDIAEINEKYKNRLERAEGDADATKRIEKQKSAEILAIKQKEAKANKAFATLDIALKTAQAIIGFLANPSGPAGVALSIAAGIIGGIQAAAVLAAPLPSFATGGFVGGAPGEDQNLIRASRGEFVVREEVASQNADLLEAINAGQSPSFQPIVAPVILDDQIVGQIMIDFIEGEANTGRLAIDPKAVRADV